MSGRHRLPEALPPGERILWQGAPAWRALARALHVRGLALYFAILLLWQAASDLRGGETLAATTLGIGKLAACACVPVALVVLYAWATAQATTYTLTDRRLAIRLGLALPMTINLPLARVDGADFRPVRNGHGDITLTLARGDRLGYLMLWPHARPWHLLRPQPMLRAIPDAEHVGRLLARTLAASADVAVVPQLLAGGHKGTISDEIPAAA